MNILIGPNAFEKIGKNWAKRVKLNVMDFLKFNYNIR